MAIALALGLTLARDVAGGAALASILALSLAWASRRAPPRVGTLALLLGLALGAAARGTAHHQRLERGRSTLGRGDRLVRLWARVCEPPADAGDEPAVIVAVRRAEPPLPRGARLRLRCPAGARIEWSDEVEGLAWLDPPDAQRNPGGFDGRRFADANALIGSGRCVWCRVSRARGLAAWPRATFGRWRTALERRLEARLSPAAREVVWPLVLGDRSDMRVGLGAELRVSGLMHLIALSGLHVSWLAQLARTFAAALGAGRRGRALVGATCALGYLGLVGPVPSLARAAMSELLVSCAELASRRVDPLQSLAWSAAVLLAVSPGWIDDFGFQLSCSATLGLVTVGSIPLDSRWAWGGVLPTTFGTLGAQAISLPLVLGSFHLLPWVAPVSNLVAVPVAGWLLSAAWLALIVDVIVPGLGAWWFRACDVLAAALESIVVRAASIPGAALAVGHDPAVLACAAAGAGLLATACARRRPPAAEPEPLPPPPASSAAIVGATLCACALVLAAWPAERRPAPGRVWLVALDVGQGDAIALGFPDGWWLVDAGPRAPRFDAGEQIVLPFLRWAGVRRLEGLAITHDDSDHCGGVPAVQRGIAIDRLIVPATLAGTPAPLARFHGVPVHARALLHATPPLVVAWPPASPSAFAPAAGVTSDNAMGLVLESGSGRGRALLTADVDSTVEARLDVRGPIGALKVGHHGSATSSGATFLARVRPAFAIVSCGRHNRFGHPDPRTLARLRAVGAAIERTDTSGARWYELDAHGVCRVEWQHPAPAAQTESAPAWPPCAVRPAARP